MPGAQDVHRGDSHRTGKDTISQACEETPSPIRGNFIPVSNPTRSRSPSPKRHQQEEGVYIHLSLTDSQVDTLATAFSPQVAPENRPRNTPKAMEADTAPGHARGTKPPSVSGSRSRSRSPVKLGNSLHSTSRSRSKSPVKHQGRGRTLGESRRAEFEFESSLASPAEFHLPSPTKKAERQASPGNTAFRSSSPSLAERRVRPAPGPIDTQLAQSYTNPKSKTYGPRPIIIQVPPSSPKQSEQFKQSKLSKQPEQSEQNQPRTPPQRQTVEDNDDSSSAYSYEEEVSTSLLYISPLHIRRAFESPEHPGVLQDYNDWKNAVTPTALPDAAPNRFLGTHHPEQPEAVSHAHRGLASPLPVYSPFTPFFSTKDMPASKTASKTMIGDNGWLERTTFSPEKKSSPTKKGGFLDNLRKKAKGMVDMGDLKGPRRPRDPEKERDVARSRLTVSLDPREQSLLYCELEFALTSALNNYITGQFNAGLLDTDKLKKVADGWLQKGRPNVVGFRYDLETQLDLVRLHAARFRFYGRPTATAALVGNLEMMKVNARAIRIRTFCQPDTVIAKQLLDSQGLFNILGCSEKEQIQLAEIVQFFKTVLERDRFFKARREARDSAVSGPGQAQQGDQTDLYGQQP